MGCVVPVEELLIDCPNGIFCSICNRRLQDDEFVHAELGDNYDLACETCSDNVLEGERTKAETFAEENCRITNKPHHYDSRYRRAPTPDDYEDGNREAYTENSVAAFNRHSCTNYDKLLKQVGLSKTETSDIANVWYDAIRQRIDDLLEAYLDEHWDDEEDDNAFDEEDDDDLLE